MVKRRRGIRKKPKIDPLIRKIRKSKKYKEWKAKILVRDGYADEPIKILKKVQVHHLKEITHILNDNEIKTVKQAMKCKELWKLKNGVTLKRGEHFILSKLSRYKHLTTGFVESLHVWLQTCTVRTGEGEPIDYSDWAD